MRGNRRKKEKKEIERKTMDTENLEKRTLRD